MVSLERCVPMDGDNDEQADECSLYLISNPPLIQAHQNMCSSICIKNRARLTFIFFFLLSVRCRLRLCMGTRMNTQLGKVSEIWICHWIFLSFEHQKILFLTVFGRSLLVFPVSLCFFLSAHSFFRSHLSADSLSCYCFLCVTYLYQIHRRLSSSLDTNIFVLYYSTSIANGSRNHRWRRSGSSENGSLK